MSKILVIDDEAPLRQMLLMALKQRGYEVIEAGDGEAGVAIARQQSPDLILSDVNMGGLDGYATLERMRADPITAGIPFILMTGAADNAGMRQGMELGADDYLPKPFTIPGLYAAVEARLKKAQKLQEAAERKLADLRSSISLMLPHELRTPLNGILAYGDILKTDAATLQPGEVSEMGQVTADSRRRMQRLIENFLIYAQIEIIESDPQKVSALRQCRTLKPEAIIKAQAGQQAEIVGRRSDLVLVDVTDQPVAMADDYLSKIVDELAHNAFKFSEPGSPVRISLSSAGGMLALVITDSGRGLDTEHIQKIGAYMQFERKFHEQQGLGLGLSICKRLAEIHGGSLDIQSQKAKGTTVTVKLPLAKA